MCQFAADVTVATGGSGGFAEVGEEDLFAAELRLVGVLKHGVEFGDEAGLTFFKDGRGEIDFRLSLVGHCKRATY